MWQSFCYLSMGNPTNRLPKKFKVHSSWQVIAKILLFKVHVYIKLSKPKRWDVVWCSRPLGMYLEDCGPLAPASPFGFLAEVSTFILPCLPRILCCFTTGWKDNWLWIGTSKTVSWNQPFLFISWLTQRFCYSDRNFQTFTVNFGYIVWACNFYIMVAIAYPFYTEIYCYILLQTKRKE